MDADLDSPVIGARRVKADESKGHPFGVLGGVQAQGGSPASSAPASGQGSFEELLKAPTKLHSKAITMLNPSGVVQGFEPKFSIKRLVSLHGKSTRTMYECIILV